MNTDHKVLLGPLMTGLQFIISKYCTGSEQAESMEGFCSIALPLLTFIAFLIIAVIIAFFFNVLYHNITNEHGRLIALTLFVVVGFLHCNHKLAIANSTLTQQITTQKEQTDKLSFLEKTYIALDQRVSALEGKPNNRTTQTSAGRERINLVELSLTPCVQSRALSGVFPGYKQSTWKLTSPQVGQAT